MWLCLSSSGNQHHKFGTGQPACPTFSVREVCLNNGTSLRLPVCLTIFKSQNVEDSKQSEHKMLINPAKSAWLAWKKHNVGEFVCFNG